MSYDRQWGDKERLCSKKNKINENHIEAVKKPVVRIKNEKKNSAYNMGRVTMQCSGDDNKKIIIIKSNDCSALVKKKL